MASNDYKGRESDLLSIYRSAVNAADPAKCIDRHLNLQGDNLELPGHSLKLQQDGRLILLAFGKASIRMARAAIQILDNRLSHGLVIAPTSSSSALPDSIRMIFGGHPVPTPGSLAAGEEVQGLLGGLGPHDIALVLISGGGSAMLELPKPGLGLDELQMVTRLLLQSGAPIDQINLVRKALSQTKAGGLARLAAPALVVGLILSDVVGNPLEAIASGPTIPENIDPEDVRKLLEEYRLWDTLPNSVRQAIYRSPAASQPGPKPINLIIGSNRLLIEAAEEKATELGFEVEATRFDLQGEARLVGDAIAQELIECRPGGCLIIGGETTVTVRGDGLGGRNQELALAAAIKLAGVKNAALISAASDGVDGPTDAAGAWVDGNTLAEAVTVGLEARQFLEQNDSYSLLDRLNRLIKTGPTGTNVNDLVVGLKYHDSGG